MNPNHHYVGRPNLGNREKFLSRISDILDRRWLSNGGPMVQEFEKSIAKFLDVKHVIAISNATAALEIASRAIGFSGEVIIPSYTFVATAHALQWQEITPVFCDMDPATHNIDPKSIERLITPRTTGIVGVHVWGRACDIESISRIAEEHSLKVMYDASHAFGCSSNGRMIGSFGDCEVFSFHATKFINSGEGGAIATNNDELAHQIRMMINFGFTGYDKVEYLGINGKMSELAAALGLTNLESIEEIVETNRRNYREYQKQIALIPGVSLVEYSSTEKNNYQYIVVEIDPNRCPKSRDTIIEFLHTHGIIARKYFWPGCHKMEPYRSLQPNAGLLLKNTESISARIIVLPTGQSTSTESIQRICNLILEFLES